MKIGVFGDSFASKYHSNKRDPRIWFDFLEHDVTAFGEPGSSILFSAKLIEQHAAEFDLVIWALTNPGRFSFKTHRSENYHMASPWDVPHGKSIDVLEKHKAFGEYVKHLFDWDDENFVSRCIVEYLINKHINIMIIPSFYDPLGCDFNLYTAGENESKFYFPKQDLYETLKTYEDIRDGHLTIENQKILAGLISQNLQPGIFQTDYTNFKQPVAPLEKAFKKL
jgi:hypothetical protein